MKVARGRFEQCYNGQIAGDMESMLIVKTDTVQATNDKQQVKSMPKQLGTLPVQLDKPATLGADISIYQWWFWNQIPVTLGNLMGGSIFTGILLYTTYGRMNNYVRL